MPTHGGKILVYLDTSLQIQFLRARSGKASAEYGRLYNLLQTLVSSGKIACPTTVQDGVERALGRDRQLVDGVATSLSRGLRFRHDESIFLAHLQRAIFAYRGCAGKLSPEPWVEIFNRDPDDDIGGFIISAHVPVDESDRQEIKLAKDAYVTEVPQLKRRGSRDYKSIRSAELAGLVEGWYPQILSAAAPAWYLTQTQENHGDMDLKRFLESNEFASIPFVDIMTQMHAGMRFYFPDRKPCASDPHDTLIMATVLPYCDLVTCDRFMEDLAKRPEIQLPAKYGAVLYDSGPQGVERLISDLGPLAA